MGYDYLQTMLSMQLQHGMELNFLETEQLHYPGKDDAWKALVWVQDLIQVSFGIYIPKSHTNYVITFQSHLTRDHNTNCNAIRMQTFFGSSVCIYYAITMKREKLFLITPNNTVPIFRCVHFSRVKYFQPLFH